MQLETTSRSLDLDAQLALVGEFDRIVKKVAQDPLKFCVIAMQHQPGITLHAQR